MSRKDFHVELRVRNNQIRERRKEMGWSQRRFAKACGVPFNVVAEYERLCRSPVVVKEEVSTWCKHALTIAGFLGVSPEVLWSDAIQAVERPVQERLMDGPQIAALQDSQAVVTSPETMLIDQELIQKSLARLDPREKQAVLLYYGFEGDGDYTLETLGAAIGNKHKTGVPVGREGCRRVIQKALRKIRHTMKVLALTEEEKRRVGRRRLHALSGWDGEVPQ